ESGFAKGEESGFAKGEESGFAKGEESGFAKGEESGFAKGRIKGLLDILSDFGAVPDEFQAHLQDIDDETLKLWTKLASTSKSMEEFLKQI
ncbi:MAG: hypothetical protein J6A45_01040, partial [Lachnospiraceae bacterium]|nr:hypothetical protein [Lachnospiraceae bacterium]